MSGRLQQKRVFAAEFEKVLGDFFTSGSYTRRGLGQPNKSGEKSFDIKIVPPSPANKHFFDQTFDHDCTHIHDDGENSHLGWQNR